MEQFRLYSVIANVNRERPISSVAADGVEG